MVTAFLAAFARRGPAAASAATSVLVAQARPSQSRRALAEPGQRRPQRSLARAAVAPTSRRPPIGACRPSTMASAAEGGGGAAAAASAADEPDVVATAPVCEPPCYLLLHSMSKRHNGTAVIRSSVALGVRCVVMAGSDKFSTFGCHGSDAYMTYKHFPKLEEAVRWLKEEQGCKVVGVEICDGAHALASAPFEGPTAFLVGNEGHGLTQEEMALCDWFVYIPQHGVGTASLNVAVATSIVLYAFAQWAVYPEAPREGQKYVLGPRPRRTHAKGEVPSQTPEEKAAERAARRAAATDAADAALEDAGALFDEPAPTTST